jgi:succinyl-CoA synthetase alpha subunit
MKEFSSPLVAGVTPNRGGQRIEGVAVFDSVAEAVKETGATCSLVVVPPLAVLDAVMEAADAGIRLTVVFSEGVAVQDTMRACAYARNLGMLLCGPNSAGIVSPGKANLSDLNDINLLRGSVGIVSKSGTLTYEIILELRKRELGTSTIVCLGGDPVVGLDYRTVLGLFERDTETKAVVLIGEIGGHMEMNATTMIRSMNKPVVAYVAGRSAPPGKRVGHAGAIISTGAESAESKMNYLRNAGARVVSLIVDVAPRVQEVIAVST